MSLYNGKIFLKLWAIALPFFLLTQKTECQQSILDSTFTFKEGTVKTGAALNIISQKTGFNFTYDSRLVDQERNTVLNFTDTRLNIIHDSILKNDSLVYSIIDKYIIISHREVRVQAACKA